MYSVAERRHALSLLAQGNRSLNSVSKEVGISRAAIREWRDDPGAALAQRPDKCAGCSEGRVLTTPASFSALFGYYLGDGCLSAARTHYVLRVSCDAKYRGIIADVTRLITDVHEGGLVCEVAAPGAVVVQNCWKHWVCLFPQHGPGRKHERVLGMADWQWEIVAAHPADFLRGLFHSDGCRANNWATRMVAGRKKRYDYPCWHFTNCSEEIMGWCGDALDLLDIPWRRSSMKMISVSTRAGVARLDELIGLKS